MKNNNNNIIKTTDPEVTPCYLQCSVSENGALLSHVGEPKKENHARAGLTETPDFCFTNIVNFANHSHQMMHKFGAINCST